MRKRLLSILLTACMVWSLLPASAWAAGDPVVAPGGSIADGASAKTAFGEDNIQIEGTTITLQKDIVATDTISFDNGVWALNLGGNTIIGAGNINNDGYVIYDVPTLTVDSSATLTLRDSGGGGAVLGGVNRTAVKVSGTLTLEGAVTLTGGACDNFNVMAYGLLVSEGGTLFLGEDAAPTLTGGSSTSFAGAGLRCSDGSTLNIGTRAAPVCIGGASTRTEEGGPGSGLELVGTVAVVGHFTDGKFAPGSGNTDGIKAIDLFGGGSTPVLSDLLAEGYSFYKVSDNSKVTLNDETSLAYSVYVDSSGGGSGGGEDPGTGPTTSPGGEIGAGTSAGQIAALMEGCEAEDSTLRLTKNVTLTDKITFTGGEWTLDLNGHTITGPDGRSALAVGAGAKLTLTSTEGGGVLGGETSGMATVDVSGTLTLEGSVALTGGGAGGNGVYAHGSGALILGEGAKPTLTGGRGSPDGVGLQCDYGTTLTIGDGAAPVCTGSSGLQLNANATVEGHFTGGTFTPASGGSGSAIYNPGNKSLLAPGYGFYKDDGTWVNGSGSVTPAVTVKPLGGSVTSDTDAAAVESIFGGNAEKDQRGQFITLTDDVTLGQEVMFSGGDWTLDLNGYTLSLAEGLSVSYAVMCVDGALTITDGYGGGGVDGGEAGAVFSTGTSLTITGGAFKGEPALGTIGTPTLTGGVFESAGGPAIDSENEPLPTLLGEECQYVDQNGDPVADGALATATYLAVKDSITVPGGSINNDSTADEIRTVFGNKATVSADGKTVTLTGNIQVESGVEFKPGTWTLDLNGHTLLGTGTSAALFLDGGDLTLKGPGAVTGGSGEAAGPAVSVGNASELILEGKLTLTGGESTDGAGGSGLALVSGSLLNLSEGLDLTCVGGNGTDNGGMGVSGDAAEVEGTLTKGYFKGGDGLNSKAFSGNPLPLAAGYGYFEPKEDREYFFGLGDPVPPVLEVRAFDKNILVDYEDPEGTTASRYFSSLKDMDSYFDYDYDGKTFNLLTDLSGALADRNEYAISVTFTVEGCGNTLSREAGIFRPLVELKHTNSGTVTLKDLTLNGAGPELPGSSQYPGPVVDSPETSCPELVIDNVTVENNGYFDPPPAEPVEEGPPDAAVVIGREANLTGTTIRNNLGDFVGGLMIYNSGKATVTNSEVSGNLGGDAGGVLSEADLAMSGVTIRGNTGITAGGVMLRGYEDPLTLTLSGTAEHPTLITGNRAAMPDFPSYYEDEVYAELPPMAGGVLTNKVILSGNVTVKGNYVGQGTGTPANLVLLELPEMGDEDYYDMAPPPETVAVVTGPLTGGAGSIGVSRVSMVMDESTWTMSIVPAPGVVARGATAEDGLTPYTLTQTDLAAFFSDSPDYALALDGNAIVMTSKGAAEVGGRYYESLPAALAAAVDGQSVRLLQNTVLQEALVIDKKVTLDLNGCTITGAVGNVAVEVENGGELTLHDDSGAGLVIGGAGQHSGVSVEDGGKLILSGKVRVTGGASDSGDGGSGVLCGDGGTLALALGAGPVLTGGSGSTNGGSGLALEHYSEVDGTLTGGTYTGGEGSQSAAYGLDIGWPDNAIRPLLIGGCYAGIQLRIVGSTYLSALLPDYCYYADEYGEKLDEQPSGERTSDTVYIARRGGPVHDIYEFQAALGGAKNALIDPQTNTVTLDKNVTLMLPVEITAGTYTLDLCGYSITGAPGAALETNNIDSAADGKPALVLNGAGVKLTVMDSDFDEDYPSAATGGAAGTFYHLDEIKIATGGAGIQVKAGALTVTGDAHVTGGDGTGDAELGYGGQGVRVLGGSLTLTGTPFITGGVGKSGGGYGVVVNTVGTLRVPQGASPTVTGGAGPSESSRGYGVQLMGTVQIAGGSYYGNSGIIIENSKSATLTVTGGSFTGSSNYGGRFSSGQSLAISGGTFQGAEGKAALWIRPSTEFAYKGILSGGSFLGEKAILMYKPTLADVDGDATPADLLAEGYHFYDGDQNMVVDLSGTQDGNNLTLTGPITVGRARWTEFADTAWYDSQKSEFTLTTAEQLAGLAKLVDDRNGLGSKTVKLGADIDLSAHDWVPIGGTVGIFYGEFDGQGHAITGMNVTGNWECAGLFSMCRGTIHDLTLSGNVSAARTSGTACVGGLAGSVFGGPIEIYNVLFTGTVSLAGRDGMVGGLVGQMEVSDTTLSNCAALAEVFVGPVGSPTGVRNIYIVYAGGLVGSMSGYDGDPKVDMRNCYAAGAVTVQPGAGPVRTAALVGDAENATGVTGPLYYLNTMGAPSGYGTFVNTPTAMTADEMQSPAFADTLSAWVTAQDEGADYAAWYAHAGAYPDFTKSGGGSSSGTGGSSSSTTTTTTTQTNPDGSKTTTVTDKKTGTVTETTKAENGVETVVKTEKDGTVTAAVTVPQTALTPPKEGGVPLVEIPGQSIPTSGSGTGEGSTAIAVDLPGALDTPVIVAIPVTDGTVVLRGDGTPVALALVEDGKAYVVLEASEELRIVTAGDFFDDVEGAAKAAADFGAARALWTGTGEREFSPEMIMNRAMLATVLWRLNGAEDPEGLELFPDVPPEAWFASAAAWGGESGVVQGTGEGFAPDVALTAEQMLVMLYRYTTYADLLVPAADDTGAGAPEGTSSWAAEAVAWAINAGLVRLGEDGDLTAPITRAQAAEIMRGYVGYLVRR